MTANMVTRYANSFDFTNTTDEQLREMFDLWAPENTVDDTADWRELYAMGRAAIIEEAHLRALGIRKYEVDVVCYGQDSSTGASWRSAETFVGTKVEFAEFYGLRGKAAPHRAQGEVVGRSANGERITMKWNRV